MPYGRINGYQITQIKHKIIPFNIGQLGLGISLEKFY